MNAVLKPLVVGGQFGANRPRRASPNIVYLSSHWHAVSHITNKGDRGTAIENDYPDPWHFFPTKIMKNVEYGLKNAGIDVFVKGYRNADGQILGVIMTLYSGDKELGCYANRFDNGIPARHIHNAREDEVGEVADQRFDLHEDGVASQIARLTH